jgi:hypothetical protein
MIKWVPIIVMSAYQDLYTEKAQEEEVETYLLNYWILVRYSPSIKYILGV